MITGKTTPPALSLEPDEPELWTDCAWRAQFESLKCRELPADFCKPPGRARRRPAVAGGSPRRGVLPGRAAPHQQRTYHPYKQKWRMAQAESAAKLIPGGPAPPARTPHSSAKRAKSCKESFQECPRELKPAPVLSSAPRSRTRHPLWARRADRFGSGPQCRFRPLHPSGPCCRHTGAFLPVE